MYSSCVLFGRVAAEPHPDIGDDMGDRWLSRSERFEMAPRDLWIVCDEALAEADGLGSTRAPGFSPRPVKGVVGEVVVCGAVRVDALHRLRFGRIRDETLVESRPEMTAEVGALDRVADIEDVFERFVGVGHGPKVESGTFALVREVDVVGHFAIWNEGI